MGACIRSEKIDCPQIVGERRCREASRTREKVRKRKGKLQRKRGKGQKLVTDGNVKLGERGVG